MDVFVNRHERKAGRKVGRNKRSAVTANDAKRVSVDAVTALRLLRPTLATLAFLSLFAIIAPLYAQTASIKVDFQREILPILSDRCFLCHGPDEGTRQADMRLDLRNDLLDHVEANSPDDSEIWIRISSNDELERMPPPESNLSLTDIEKELIRQWIEEGANWSRHWSLEPLPKTVEIPEVVDSKWPANPIDRFVLAKLESMEQTPTQVAPRWRWLRRVTFDLTGLPPTPDEIGAFENDLSPEAFETVVARLLSSPRFGEQMAISWFDAARYADSYGYQSDLLSPTWPWRDWVIRAINENLSYDQFLTWQLAGDLLPDATTDQILATTFNRLHRMTNEGGSIELEWHTEYVADRVNTFGTSILGMTFECARCHDHKFDAITHQDYYNLFAFFNNIDEWGMYNDSSRVPTPSLLLPNDEQQRSMSAARMELERAKSAVDDYRASMSSITSVPAEAMNSELQIAPIAAFDFESLVDNKWLTNEICADQPGETGPANILVPGKTGNGIKLTGDDDVSIGKVENGLNPWERFAVSMWVWIPEDLNDVVLLHHTGGTDVGVFGTNLTLFEGKFRFSMSRFWPGNALAIESNRAAKKGKWTHIVIANEATGSADGLQLYVDSVSENHILRDYLTKRPDTGGNGFTLGARFRSAGFKNGIIDELKVFDRPLSAVEVRVLTGTAASDVESRISPSDRAQHALLVDKKYNELAATRAAACKSLLDAQTDILEVSVMREMDQVQVAWVLARGNYDSPRTDSNRAHRIAPSALPPFGDETSNNRLSLARWLTGSEHPLTSRVAVNRLWSNFFDSGLVATMNDFGVQGHRPTHPELLDWLARDFIDSGWDVKRFCKQLVLSSTYRQDSVAQAEAWKTDPKNEMLARGPSRRLSSEMIRDLALSAAGLLNDTPGGPPVSPYQPDNLWQEDNSMTPAYQQSVGTDLYRRSIYTVWKRTAPIPNMLLFDSAGREVCSMSRTATNTPLQALVLLNDPQFVEAARVMAENEIKLRSDDTETSIRSMFMQLTGREPGDQELSLLVEHYKEQLVWFGENPADAEKILAIGQNPVQAGLAKPSIAALTVVAQAILGCDASIWKR